MLRQISQIIFIKKIRDILSGFLKKNQNYPVLIRQKRLIPIGVLFEATNQLEESRVRQLDDEEEFLQLMLDELKDDDILYDIGACVGLFSIHAALRCERVFAFEPDPGLQERIKRNCGLNQVTNITILPWAVSNQRGQTTLYTGGVSGRSPSLRDFGQGKPIVVNTHSIDDDIALGVLPPPAVIKMDIEGAEFLALSGMARLLSSSAPPRAIFVEIHPSFLEQFGSTAEEVFTLMRSEGYQVSYRLRRDEQEHVIFNKPMLS